MAFRKKKNTSFNIPSGKPVADVNYKKNPSKRKKGKETAGSISVGNSVNMVSNVGNSSLNSADPGKTEVIPSISRTQTKKVNPVDVNVPKDINPYQETLLKAQDIAAKKKETAQESTQNLFPVGTIGEANDVSQQNPAYSNNNTSFDELADLVSDKNARNSSSAEQAPLEDSSSDKGYKSVFDEAEPSSGTGADENFTNSKEEFASVSESKTTSKEELAKEAKDSLKDRKREKRKAKLKHFIRGLIITLAVVLILCGVGMYIYLYQSDMFTIEHVQINGVNHLTQEEMSKLANIEDDATLLRVDTDTIKTRLLMDAWIEDVDIVKEFPSTLVINVKERSATAIVEVPTSAQNSKTTTQGSTVAEGTVRNWAISKDHMWLMPVPDKNSEAGKNINQQIYEDVEGVMHIVDVSPSLNPEIGTYCTDENVNCAIDVVASMTTSLVDQVKNVKASDPNSTTLMLKNGVEIALGTAENIRDKERVCLDLLSKYEGKISYINVRDVSNPTWRTI